MDSAPLLTVVIPWRGDPRIDGLCQHASHSRARDSFRILIVVDGRQTRSFETQLSACISKVAAVVATTVVENRQGGGPGAARNEGLRHVRTPYVHFADSDDVPDFDELVRAARFMQAHETQILVGGYKVLRGRQVIRVHLPVPRSRLDEELVEVAGIWRFVFETAFLRDSQVEFPTTAYGEDAVFLVELHDRHPRLSVWPDAVYTYRDHSSLGRLTKSRPTTEDVDLVATRLWRLANGSDSRTRDLARYWLARVALHQRDLSLLTGSVPGTWRPLLSSSGWSLLHSSVRLHRARRRLRRRDESLRKRQMESTGVGH